MVSTRKARTRTRRDANMKNWNTIDLEDGENDGAPPPRKSGRRPALLLDDSASSSVTIPSLANSSDDEESSDSEEDSDVPRRSSRVVKKQKRQKRVRISNVRSKRNTRPTNMRVVRSRYGRQDSSEGEVESSSDGDGFRVLQSDINRRKRKRGDESNARRSGRNRRSVNMAEVGEDNIYRTDDSRENVKAPKVIAVREIFKPLARDNQFRTRHMNVCDSCRAAVGDLVHCQGCSLSYHKNCLGHRSGREHIITKIGDGDFVLQCRRCVNVYRRRDPTAPDLARCQDCKQTGESCTAFKDRKSTAQEQKDREENDGVDPITYVVLTRINNAANLMFRCISCWRAWHFHHLPPRRQWDIELNDSEDRADNRFLEYSGNWRCLDCHELENKKISNLVAWRPVDVDAYQPDIPVEFVEEDEKEYLVKWEGFSYFQVQWMSGAWVWGFASSSQRKAFFKRGPRPKMTTEGAIPEEYLRIDIVLDVKYTNRIDIRTDEIDRARIREVDLALIKYKGLGYEDAVWEKVPEPEDGDRWTDFVSAYNDWVLGRYTHIPRGAQLRARIEKVRKQEFKELEKTVQPENLTGGDLMKYQLEGLNWMYYQWHSQRNGILADEMGLGKTIQVIAFLAMMALDHNCFPFLVVVPNSTCPNWRREIKQWAPSLRVVAYYGSAMARQMASDYELFPENSKDLHCHVVVTSYEAIQDESSRRFFKSVPWQGLIVDEGQRLKNDRSILHTTLSSFKIPFRMLLTGTPLQNNARELFNLLQFLEDTIDAQQMEQEYANMTNENISKLHDLIRPYILRRTKAQVLTFLPAMSQIILPVSMSTLQKKLYKSIMAKNPELLRALFDQKTLKNNERANLNNILMQLRKCLCHPFVYSQAIEERNLQASALHRNLVEASPKLQLLELLLPKLRERGHRVLIFSQFLDMLNIVEDFLDGLGLPYQRLDGTVNSLTKQKRIDEFNAPNSPLFAFLLSTRAGGVGINLATADTVIILDPDFNPHQDIQALSRAHRIGQTKKVLCFQLMTRASAEEKIIQIGRKKMALDHIVVDQMDAEDMEDRDVESILRHGAAELFNDNGEGSDIRYDDASIEKLLDRNQIENPKAGLDDSAESQFSFARVWANDQEQLEDALESSEEEAPPDPGLWDKILKERERVAAAEAAAKAEAFGRGRRARVVSSALYLE
jgi:chromodomain-helicase-DNA-binding protein 4